jgi:hypothetical protein
MIAARTKMGIICVDLRMILRSKKTSKKEKRPLPDGDLTVAAQNQLRNSSMPSASTRQSHKPGATRRIAIHSCGRLTLEVHRNP